MGHMRRRLWTALLLAFLAPVAFAEEPLSAAQQLAQDAIIVDGHIDAPMMQLMHWQDLAVAGEHEFDYPLARAGGLDAPFMSIYVPARYQTDGGAKALADQLIDRVEKMVALAPDRFALAKSPKDVRREHLEGKVALPMGMENGAGIEGDLDNLEHFYARGIRYITLSHFAPNLICDSSSSPERPHHGLSEFGAQVVQRMNALGIMVDVSHISDESFYDVVALSAVPVIASHSSARHFTPGWERNMSDDMIDTLAAHGGVIMINFGSGFLTAESGAAYNNAMTAIRGYMQTHGIKDYDNAELRAYIADYQKRHPFPYASVQDVAEHIDYVARRVGVDHVGLGSDFDGVGDTLPTGLKNVGNYPNLIAALMSRGYSDDDIRKILGENLLRVWAEVERYAQTHTDSTSADAAIVP